VTKGDPGGDLHTSLVALSRGDSPVCIEIEACHPPLENTYPYRGAVENKEQEILNCTWTIRLKQEEIAS
jgi:hypothetical protein